jgi:hypothetical protein
VDWNAAAGSIWGLKGLWPYLGGCCRTPCCRALQYPPGQDLSWRDRDGEVGGPQALRAMFDLNKIRSLELSKDVSCDCFTDVGGGCLGLS